MESVRVFLLCGLVLLVLPPVSSSPGVWSISAHVGDDVTLTCKTSGGLNLEDAAVNWTRPDLGQYVFFYRDGRPDPEEQHPSYQGRVDLVHSQLTDGDLSVVLKNVRANDSGTFECYLIPMLENQTEGSRSEPKLLSTIVLKVSDPAGSSGNRKETGDDGGHEDSGNLGLTVGLSVIGFTGFIVAVLLVSRRRGVSCRGPSVFSRDLEDRCSTVSETVESMV
ncbi:myelin-oligodendrocyte glycoprotein-like isoform X4 [Sphaeramia orbicularis]|uniref:myelin-oligodendrocyte glycoprotein-like isoform X4 n=1 Tax=Sphaeramia orbicularis TaxID=375764 RepID=UPI001181750B|nr:myelin-oligodendrocyte glycoprotein-like isoform X4 [Sphaeramia orbicularis]